MARAVALAAVVVLSVFSGTFVSASPSTSLGSVATVDATPSDPNEAESTHAVTVPLGTEAGSIGSQWNDIVVNYNVEAPKADVSNVGAETIERVGIDRGNDDAGTRIDTNATVLTVSGKKDGHAVRIGLAGNLTLRENDELVVVLRPVQNPQNAGNPQVEITVNSQSSADTATGEVTYEYNDASVTFENQSSDGQTVVVSSVNLSEGGFVAVQNKSGDHPDEIRGASAYLSPGTHQNVEVSLDPALRENRTLVAQVYTDTNGDHRFTYDEEGGEEDWPYRNRNGNIMATDDAAVTLDGEGESTSTPTPTQTQTQTPMPGTATPGSGTATPTTGTATPTGTPGSGTVTPTGKTPPATQSPTTEKGAGIQTETGPRTGGSIGTPTTAGGVPGFGPVVALLAGSLVVAGLLVARRR